MAQASPIELVNQETCSNANCKFSNVSGAKNCEKCGEELTGGTQWSVSSHSIATSEAEQPETL